MRDAFEVRSKNAGPFWLTIDIFFHDGASFARYCASDVLTKERIAALLAADPDLVSLHPMPALNVLKISLPRPVPQGSVYDRDMHGAQWAWLLERELKRIPS